MPKGFKKDGTKSGFKKGNIPWNKNLTKETDLRVLKNGQKISKSMKGNPLIIGTKSSRWRKEEKYQRNNRWHIRINVNDSPIRQSRWIAESCLERSLKKGEIVHHINEDPSDDRPENLYVFSTRGDHIGYHNLKNKPILVSNITKSNNK